MEFSQVPQQEQEDLLDQFPEEVQDDVEGLAFLGYLETDFDFCGHHFVIRTLRGDDELHASAVTKEYKETLGEGKAWIWAQIALALEAVDGDPEFCPPISPDKRDFARARFRYVTTKWFWPLAEYIYARFTELNGRQLAAMEAMRDLSARSLPSFSPLADSSTEAGASSEQTDSESQT